MYLCLCHFLFSFFLSFFLLPLLCLLPFFFAHYLYLFVCLSNLTIWLSSYISSYLAICCEKRARPCQRARHREPAPRPPQSGVATEVVCAPAEEPDSLTGPELSASCFVPSSRDFLIIHSFFIHVLETSSISFSATEIVAKLPVITQSWFVHSRVAT